MLEEFSFLDSWRMLLPDRFPCVLAVAGQGGKSTLLSKLVEVFREDDREALLVRSAAGPAPRAGEGRAILVDPRDDLRALAKRSAVDVVLVEAQDSCGSLVWPDAPRPRWPADTDLAFGVANLQALGRLWGPAVVHTAPEVENTQRRVVTQDLLNALASQGADTGCLEHGAPWIPFLTGLASLRDMDAMFEIGQALFTRGARAVCFGELLGDARRDDADRQSVEGSPAADDLLAGERIYAIHAGDPDSGTGWRS